MACCTSPATTTPRGPIDARTGRQLWRHRRQLPSGLTYGSGNASNRGFAVLGDRLFMGTLDAHLVALDRKTGRVLWDIAVDDFKVGYAVTQAPLVVKDKVIIGIAGGDLPTRGFIDAYDPDTGARVWRFYTIPAAGEPGSETWSDPAVLPRGGGATWQTGSYDPGAQPDLLGHWQSATRIISARIARAPISIRRRIIALDADTGKLRWHYQFTPHDLHDWDSNHVPVLADLTVGGRARKVVMVANRNGFFYTLDRTTGELLVGKPFTDTKWARELAPDGKPIVLNLGAATPDNPKPTVRARLSRRDELQSAVVRSGAAAVLRDGPRDMRDLHAAEAGDGARPRRS